MITKLFFKPYFKWSLYILLLVAGLVLNFHKYIVEQYMRFALRNDHIVISFTTTPYRINEMRDTVATILKQNINVDAIYLSVPYVFRRENMPYVIPEWVLKEPKITILRTEDYGPATKLLGVLEQTNLPKDAIVITMDDDVTYPRNAALHLAYSAKKNPGIAFGLAAVNPIYDDNGIIVLNNTGGFSTILKDNNAAILQGFGSVVYRRGFFDNNIFNIANAPRECINSDDLYISYYLAHQKVPRKLLKNRYISIGKLFYLNDIALKPDALRNLQPRESDRHRSCLAYLKQQQPEVEF